MAEAARIKREKETIGAMIEMYCRAQHSAAAPPCEACAELHAYALRRIEACRFGAAKPVCSQCAIHCYRPEMRESIRVVMRFAGPRMLRSHPRLALWHLVDTVRHRPRAVRSGSNEREPQ